MAWIKLIASALVIIIAGTQLTRNAKIITGRIGLGPLWGGVLLLPLGTSLPELVTSWRAGAIGAPDLALGNILGSCLFNLTIIAFIDLFQGKGALLARADKRHIMTASLVIILLSLTSASIGSPFNISIGWVGLDTIAVLLLYLTGSYFLSLNEKSNHDRENMEESRGEEGSSTASPRAYFKRSLLIFLGSAVLIIAAGVNLTDAADTIAVETGLGRAFIGSLLLALATSLPELVTTFTAVRLGWLDMAVGNVFGSSLMNLMILFFADLFYPQGSLLSSVSRSHLVTIAFTIALTSMAVFSLIYRSRKEIAHIGYDSLAILAGYFLAFIYLYYLEAVL